MGRVDLHKLSEVAQLGKLEYNEEGFAKRLTAHSKQVHNVLVPSNHLGKGDFDLRLSQGEVTSKKNKRHLILDCQDTCPEPPPANLFSIKISAKRSFLLG